MLDEPARRVGDDRVLGPGDDRRERPVHVEHDRRLAWSLGQARKQPLRLHLPWTIRTCCLVLIGLAAGFFSALFGVGGGIIIVPLLLVFAHFLQRPAMATSLAAIGLIAVAGTISYGFHGELKPGAAAIVGIPGAVGAIAGTALQQRLANRTLSLLFALLLLAIGVKLLV